MPFFLVDDQFHLHPKVTGLIEAEPAAAAGQAITLWVLAGSMCQAKLADGVVSLGDATRLLLSRPAATRAAKLLVKYGLWEVHPDGWVFHDWFDMRYDPGVKVKATRQRRRELRDPVIRAAVIERDQDRCRYCARKVKPSDQKTGAGRTFDHVIPGLPGGVSNLATTCRDCNNQKMQRTPEQAGMTLLPPITERPDLYAKGRGSTAKSDSWQANGIGFQVSPMGEGEGEGRVREEGGVSASVEGGVPGGVDGPAPGWVAGPRAGVLRGPRGEVGPAGDPPPGALLPLEHEAGRAGSPFHGWSGPPPEVEPSQCPAHHLDEPCRECTREGLESDQGS